MSFREYLANLDGDKLIQCFEGLADVTAQTPDTTRAASALRQDMIEGYPGLIALVHHIAIELSGSTSGLSEEQDRIFGAGALAGGLLVAHVLRSQAEIDDMGSAFHPQSD